MANPSSYQPLLSPTVDGEQNDSIIRQSFVDEARDIGPITGIHQFYKEFLKESQKLWYLAGPAIFATVCQYSLGAITQAFAGHVGTLELAAFTIENSVIAGLSLGIMVGMGSALETLCGQAFGAKQMEMLGVYMQRSLVILLTTALILTPIYVFATPLLLLIGQTEDISQMAGKYALWMIPQLYAYALNYPVVKFLQAQSKIMVMAWISAVGLVFHAVLSWLFMLKLGWGMAGGAVVLNVTWWLMVVAQLMYSISGTCGSAWSGFSMQAFKNLWGFVKLSFASGVMLCLELWYYMALVLFAGYLKNAEIAVDALSICSNILGWTITVALGFNAAISVRVSNELGASHPRTAKFAVMVVVISSFLVSLLICILLLVFKNEYPSLFSNNTAVKDAVHDLTPILAFCIVMNNIQPAISGVAVGAGWQALVAYVNIGCYYIVGIPLGLTMGYVLDLGVKGIWYGMITGTLTQTAILFWLIYKTNWNKEADVAFQRIKEWGG